MSTLATNRKAYRDYEILEEFEAGIKLTGHEVKSSKNAQVNLTDAYVQIRDNNAVLFNTYIAPYKKASHDGGGVDPYRTRRLLLHKDELTNLKRKSQAGNLTIVPLKMYTTRGLVKVKIALARGKRKYEKKRAQKEREIRSQAEREAEHLRDLTDKV